MLKTLVKVLLAGTIGALSIVGGYLVLAVHNGWMPNGMSDLGIIALLLSPIPIGLCIAWAAYRILDSI